MDLIELVATTVGVLGAVTGILIPRFWRKDSMGSDDALAKLKEKLNLPEVERRAELRRALQVARDGARLRHLRAEQDRKLYVQLMFAGIGAIFAVMTSADAPGGHLVYLGLVAATLSFLVAALLSDPAKKQVEYERAERTLKISRAGSEVSSLDQITSTT